MNVTFGQRKAIHQPLNHINPAQSTESFAQEAEAKIAPRGVRLSPTVILFLVGVLMGAGPMWLYHEQTVEMIYGFARQGGLMHTDPAGNRYWGEGINGARYTRGMSEQR